jgi:hypothetical protein
VRRRWHWFWYPPSIPLSLGGGGTTRDKVPAPYANRVGVAHGDILNEIAGWPRTVVRYSKWRWCMNMVWLHLPLSFEPYLIRTEIGMPRLVILLRALQAILASVF